MNVGRQKVQRGTGTSNRAEAQEFHDKLKVQLWEQERLGLKTRHSWKEAVIRWLNETSDKATHHEDVSKLKWLDKFLGDLMLEEVNLDCIDKIRSEKLKEASKATVNRYLALIRSILIRACQEWEWIERTPKIRLFKESNVRERSLTIEQAKALLNELPSHQRSTVLFALTTGLRLSNVVKLEWAQVNLDLKHAWVKGNESKNRKPIAIPLNNVAIEVLQQQLGNHPERVFTYLGRPFVAANTKAWKNALKRAGIEDFRWHDLRHTWATWQRQAGTPTHELQRLGGWKTASMVERYAHVAPDNLEHAASRLNAVFSGYDLATVD
ncbi:tyrosine-type recombinase/integrase [Methylotenera sp.]|uniref:tyrosine-type recombinase/integrase n=1 Tax=Methylotenera sp. TaxID=2051956 RepID=UPI0039C9631A